MIKAFGKRIIISLVDLSIEKKVGSLIMPSKDDTSTGIVISYGSEVDTGIDLGDIIYFNKRDGMSVKINGEEYLSVHEGCVVAAWKDK